MKHLTLRDISNITAVAIHHGAGIYNAGSFVGCATVYLHAAQRTLKHLPDVSRTARGAPASGTRLAAQWLAGIVTSNPAVDEATADDLAWELRFAFDAIAHISFFDQVSTAIHLAGPAAGEADAVEILKIVEKTNTLREQLMQAHVYTYLLRHTAVAILSTINRCYINEAPPPGPLRAWQKSLQPVIDAHPRITRYNAKQLAAELTKLLRTSSGGTPAGAIFGSN